MGVLSNLHPLGGLGGREYGSMVVWVPIVGFGCGVGLCNNGGEAVVVISMSGFLGCDGFCFFGLRDRMRDKK